MKSVKALIATGMFLGLAASGAMAGAGDKAADKAPPAGDKAADKKPAPPAMEMPKPPQEVADMTKKMVGTWTCKGTVKGMDGADHPTEGKLQFSVDLDKWWIKASLTETKTKTPYKFESFASFDAASKKWTQISIDNMGSYRVLTSDGPKDNVVTWTGTTTMMGHSMQVKAVHTSVNDKDTKIDESMSMDGGKTWMPSVAVECKK